MYGQIHSLKHFLSSREQLMSDRFELEQHKGDSYSISYTVMKVNFGIHDLYSVLHVRAFTKALIFIRLFMSDDITESKCSQALDVVFDIQYSYSLYMLRKVQHFILCHRPRSSYYGSLFPP